MGVDIAIIDSGINPWHSHVQGVEGGIAFRLDAAGRVLRGDDFRDELGHGTAIAGVIREKVPQAGLYAVKIFHRKLEAPMVLLREALEWALAKRVNIVHLSLGTEREEFKLGLARLCRQAYESHTVIVAAARTAEDRLYPATFDSVIGVYWSRDCRENSLVYDPEKPVAFGAYGRPRAIAGLPQEQNFCGSSFAAAQVTGMAAQFLEQNPGAGVLEVKGMLQMAARGGIRKYGTKRARQQKEVYR
ncbi:MAG: S8 family serine peptidase [Desulfobacterales bacterium]|nr:MAG: S8 family serine peptidase [Desulfobacterales bacterium]